YPERTAALVVRSAFPRRMWAPDYPWGRTEEQYEREVERDLRVFGPREQARESVRSLGTFDDEEVETYLEMLRVGSSPRALAAVLFTDIVGSTARAADLGDRRWRELLEEHHALIRRQLVRFRGRELDTAGDGFFASFDGPARGVRCACVITEGVRDLGLEVRAGLHTGE